MDILRVNNISIKINNRIVLDRLSFTIREGEQYAITGPSGTGKTVLLQAIAGTRFHTGTIEKGEQAKRIVLIEQQHRFRNLSNTNTFYYQQRFNSADSEDTVTVEEDLRRSGSANQDAAAGAEEMQHVIQALRLENLLQTRLIQLSNGENKRLQIAKALLKHPHILLLDKPFTGLDAEARKALPELLQAIVEKGIHIILVTAEGAIPSFVTHVISLRPDGSSIVREKAAFNEQVSVSGSENRFIPDEQLMSSLLEQQSPVTYGYIVKMKDVHVQYNKRVILDHINWEVRPGEKWSLSGPNGAGKSTLLSLINADNPQAYANDIYLFDRKRGTGETIWEIKKKTGYVSPELHLYFDQSISCFDVVASGLFDTIGLFRVLNGEQEKKVKGWMDLLKVGHLRSRLLSQLSLSSQRLVLLARALVKNPPLLILDEPCQGLDDDQVVFFRSIIDEISIRNNKTLIYVSHYPHEIPSCVDKFIRLENGRMV
ncbi:MAG: ATP-binding cassette domain-containing protein [Williamsia sp.]|nr:ATP-binding cassette domain-containing protein [Williamsia sp.]